MRRYPHCTGQRTSTEGKARETSEVPEPQCGPEPFEPTSGGLAWPRGEKPCRGRGNLRREKTQERTPHETRRRGSREEKRVKGARNSEDAAYPGEANPGKSLPDSLKRCRDRNPGEAASRLRARMHSGTVILRRGAQAHEGSVDRVIESTAAEVGKPRTGSLRILVRGCA